jgi:hypothetical protein
MTIEDITDQLRREGYRWWAHDTGTEIRVELACGIDVLPAPVPRPHGSGGMLLAALQAAIICRNEILARLRKGAA